MDAPKTREEAEKVCKFWGINEPERMHATTPDEAIADYLEQWRPEHLRDETATIDLGGYVPMAVSAVHSPLESLLEVLDEEYGDPDGHGAKPTPAMEAAEKVFLAAVLAEYKTWNHEDIYHETINVAEWVRANRPEWLEPTS